LVGGDLLLDKPILEAVKILQDSAKLWVKNNNGTLVGALIEGDDSEVIPTDIEAEAKARLKGTVGGVQGIIQIKESVSNGISTRDSAITMLMEIYGYSKEVATKILGETIKKDVVPISE
jgi:hypothetical protein